MVLSYQQAQISMFNVKIDPQLKKIDMYVTGRCVLPLVGPQIGRLKSKLGPTRDFPSLWHKRRKKKILIEKNFANTF